LIATNTKRFPNTQFEEKPIKFFCLTYSVKLLHITNKQSFQ